MKNILMCLAVLLASEAQAVTYYCKIKNSEISTFYSLDYFYVDTTAFKASTGSSSAWNNSVKISRERVGDSYRYYWSSQVLGKDGREREVAFSFRPVKSGNKLDIDQKDPPITLWPKSWFVSVSCKEG